MKCRRIIIERPVLVLLALLILSSAVNAQTTCQAPPSDYLSRFECLVTVLLCIIAYLTAPVVLLMLVLGGARFLSDEPVKRKGGKQVIMLAIGGAVMVACLLGLASTFAGISLGICWSGAAITTAPEQPTASTTINTPPKMTIIFIPVNWATGMDQFEKAADEHMDFVRDNVPLKDCPSAIKMVKSTTNCEVTFGSCKLLEMVKVLVDIGVCADATGESYDYAIGLGDYDVCGTTRGWSYATFSSIFAESDSKVAALHELGHKWGLNDEYYDACRCGGYGLENLNANCLDASIGGSDHDPEFTSDYCAGGTKCPDPIEITCYGNINPQGGRCIMGTSGGDGEPRAFCEHCIAHLKDMPEFKC